MTSSPEHRANGKGVGQRRFPWTVQSPAHGAFEYTALQWSDRPVQQGLNKGKLVQEAYIHTSRVPDLIQGESQRGNTTFVALNVKRARDNTDLKRLQTNSYINQKTLHCRYGPTDNSKAVPVKLLLPKAERPANTRVGKVERGLSCKRGCLMSITASQLALWPEITHIVGKHFDHCNSAGVYCHGLYADCHVKKKHKHAYAPHLVQHVTPAEHGDTDTRDHIMNATDTTIAVPSLSPAANDQTLASGDSATAADNCATAAADNATATECGVAASTKASAMQHGNSMDKQALALFSAIIASCNGEQKLLNVFVSHLRQAQNTIGGIKARNSLGKACSAPAAAQKLDAPHDSIADLAATLTQRQAAASRSSTACPAACSNYNCAEPAIAVAHAAQDQSPNCVACSADTAAPAAFSVPVPKGRIAQGTLSGLSQTQDSITGCVAQKSSSGEVASAKQLLLGLQRTAVAKSLPCDNSSGCRMKKRKTSTEPAAGRTVSLY